MVKRLFLLSVIALIIGGCQTTGTKIYIDRTTALAQTEKKRQNLPELQNIVVITPGESLISSYFVNIRKGIMLLETVKHNGKFNGFTNTYIVEAGELPLMAADSTGVFYGGARRVRQIVSASNTNKLVGGGIFIPNSPAANHSLFIDNITSAIEPLNRKVSYKETDIVVVSPKGLRQELIYTGKSGNNINIEYREFKGNIARPAFSQSLTYDISNDSLIGFRGALIEVFEATNSSIKYKVIKHISN